MTQPELGSGAPDETWRPAIYFTSLTSILSRAGSFWIFCLTFLICADVVARNFSNRPINGVAEMVGYSVVAAIYLQLANTIRAGRFIRAEVLISTLEANRPIAAGVFNALFSLIGVLVFIGIAAGSWSKVVEAWPDLRFGNAESFSILVWPLRAIVLTGSVLAAIEYLSEPATNLGAVLRAVGSMGAFIIALVKRSLTLQGLWNVMVETGQISVSIMFLILAANVYGRMLALSGLPQEMGSLITGLDLGFYAFIALYLAVLIVLGMFLDSVSIMLIILPLVLSAVEAFGADLIWFGIVTVIVVEMGLLTPPFGLSCYVVKSVLDDDRVSLNDIFVGALPFVFIMLAVSILLVVFPTISLVFV